MENILVYALRCIARSSSMLPLCSAIPRRGGGRTHPRDEGTLSHIREGEVGSFRQTLQYLVSLGQGLASRRSTPGTRSFSLRPVANKSESATMMHHRMASLTSENPSKKHRWRNPVWARNSSRFLTVRSFDEVANTRWWT